MRTRTKLFVIRIKNPAHPYIATVVRNFEISQLSSKLVGTSHLAIPVYAAKQSIVSVNSTDYMNYVSQETALALIQTGQPIIIYGNCTLNFPSLNSARNSNVFVVPQDKTLLVNAAQTPLQYFILI